jgi:glycosyltransferase involved in cell wall biosynthesis/hydroxymethylpyrimidine pyrophosphatase-like HAD family hydrolase
MKIYYASQSFYPHIGGVSTYLMNLANEMVKNGNEVTEVHLRPSGEVNKDEIKGIEIHRVPKEPIDKKIMEEYSKFKEAIYKDCHYKRNEFLKPADEMEGYESYNKVNEYFGEELKELLEQSPADVVHIHDFQLLFTYKFVPRGTPLILTWHIPFTRKLSKHLSEFLVKHLSEYDKVVFSSPEYIKAAVKAGFPKEKAELIYPIANTDLFKVMEINKEETREKYGLPKKAKIVLSVQRIDPKSGHEQLIKAMPYILKKVPDAKLVFVGEKSLSSQLSKEREILTKKIKKTVKKLGLKNHVIFLGNINYHSLPEFYNCVDVVALCSKNEGFGLSVTEGMACGKPVVGTRVGGIKLQVKDGVNGFLVEVGNVKQTAEKIIKLLKNEKLRKKMSMKSLELIEKEFKMEKGIEKHLMLYNKLIKEKNEFHKIEHLDITEIKAIITDFDRTITEKPAKQEFNKKDLDMKLLNELKSLNKDLFLVTGRDFDYVKKMASEVKIWRGIIAENGAVIYFPKTTKTFFINTKYMVKAKRIIKNLNLPKTRIGKIITSNRLQDEEIIKKKLGKIADKVDFKRNVNEVMVVPKGVDKGMSLRLAMRYLNIDLEKTIAIADGENDIDLFMNPGFKIALANANNKLKKLANEITENPSVKGVREIIKKLKQ